jgi:hypothetical protein
MNPDGKTTKDRVLYALKCSRLNWTMMYRRGRCVICKKPAVVWNGVLCEKCLKALSPK